MIQLSLPSCETNCPAVSAWQKIATEVRLVSIAKGRSDTALRLDAIVRTSLTCGMGHPFVVSAIQRSPTISDGRSG